MMKKWEKWKLLFTLMIPILIFSCANYDFYNNQITKGIEFNSFVNVDANSVLDFQYDKLFYCIPACDAEFSQNKWLEYGYGIYEIDYKNKIITINNEPISKLRLPSRSYFIELDDSNLKNDEYHLKIIDKDNNPVTFKKISFGRECFFDSINDPDSMQINYKLNITAEDKLLSSKIDIEDGSITAGSPGQGNKFDPVKINISNRKKGSYLVVLHKETSFAWMGGVSKIKFELIIKEGGRKQLLVNFGNNPQKTLLNIVE
jgi:hypothetical protein